MSAQAPTMDTKVPATMPRRGVRLLAALVVAGAATTGGLALWAPWKGSETGAERIRLSGRIEGDEAAVAPKVGGRLRELTVREGDTVRAGQVVAVLDDEQVRAREDEAGFAVLQADAQATRAKRQVAVLNAQLEQTRIGTGRARTDVAGRVAQAEAQVAAAEAELARAEATLRQSRADADRAARLLEVGVISEQEAERSATAFAGHGRPRPGLRARASTPPRGALAAVKADLVSPDMRAMEALAVERQLLQVEAEIAAAEADASRARARLAEAEANRSDLRVVAPFDGTVVTRSGEPGEVLMAGTPIVVLVDLWARSTCAASCRRVNRPRQGRSARARLSRFGPAETAGRSRGRAHRSAGHLHAREHLFS